MNLLRKWVAERRRPEIITEQYLEWVLIKNRFFSLSLLCYTHSDDEDDYRPSDLPHALLLLEGEYMQVTEETIYDAQNNKDYKAETIERITGPSLRVHGPSELYHIELHEPKTYGDKILDMPGWMNHSDIRMDTKAQAWFLFWSWSWNPSST